MLGATVAALLWANSPWSDSYESVWTTELSIRLGGDGISLDLREWVNQGLMTFYFLVVGLEAKRELDLGALRERRRIVIPVVAAAVGMSRAGADLPGLQRRRPGRPGWGAAMSTDTAFALGVLALLAPGATRLRSTLLTLAVFDDLVALIVIATVYTEHVSLVPLAVAVGLFALLAALRFAPGRVARAARGDRRRGGVGRALSPASTRSSPGSQSVSSRARIRRHARTSSGSPSSRARSASSRRPSSRARPSSASPRRSRRTTGSSTACIRGRAS